MALLRSSNPAFRSSIYAGQGTVAYGEAMTVNGTIHKTGILLLCVMASALFTWSQVYHVEDKSVVMPEMLIGIFGGLVVSLVTCFKAQWAPVTAPVYALCEGLALGGISAFAETAYPGIAIQAVGLTFVTCFIMLAVYRSGLIQPTRRFMIGVMTATGGICATYLISMLLGLFGIHIPVIFGAGPIGIIFSLVVVTIAALNLILDFAMVEQGAANGAPKYMEWYSAFALLVTLVWLYLEILRLLSKLRSRR
jgi:uncharacterized YccA/Bax inhibitor family protein